jgi:hypothetical protein
MFYLETPLGQVLFDLGPLPSCFSICGMGIDDDVNFPPGRHAE